jgi:CheY-like chemotaxis protein/signal transduction histidine kinase/CHASE3 domain sensor protein
MLYLDKVDVNNKLKWGMGFSLLILLVSSVLAYMSIMKLIGQSREVDHTREVMLNLEYINSTLKDAETGQRGFLLTGEKRFMDPYIGSLQRAMTYCGTVRELTAGNASQQLLLDSLEKAVARRFARLQAVIDIKRQGNRISLDDMESGRGLMLECKLLVSRMQNEQLNRLHVRTTDVQRYATVTPLVIALSSFLSMLVAAVSLFFIMRDIKRREATAKELERYNYLLAGNAELNRLLRGEVTMQGLAEDVITHLTTYLESQCGLIYLRNENGKYQLTSAYGIARDHALPAFGPGETLAGQCAVERKVFRLGEVPAESLRIESMLVSARPASVLIVPFHHNGETVAVAEILSTTPFTELDTEYAESLSGPVAMFIINLQSGLKNLELLAETQNQAEELEAQQEELRLTNDELRDQRDRLQASEEEIRASEEELQEKNAELELQYENLRTRNKELEDARQAVQLKISQVETVSKYKSDFLANMSHELRTPLNSILIFATLLKDNKSGHLSGKEVEQAAIIEKSGNDLLKLINEILDLARVESGKIKLELKDCPVRNLGVETQFEQLAADRQIHFEVKIDPEVPRSIVTDRFRLEQILKNLLSNAFKFTSEGGKVVYEITMVDSPRLRNSKHEGKALAFRVRDTGIGIPSEKRDLIFEAFQQADPSTTRKYGGSGLGLTISRDIANLLGGEIHVTSEPGKGSEFTLYLPLKKNESKPLTAAAAPEPKAVLTPAPVNAVLIIEDDEAFSKMLQDYTQKKGFHPITARTGEEGLRLAATPSLKAIILDVQLPDMNGWDVLKQIREDRRLKHVPVHMMSAQDMPAGQQNRGQAQYLTKPVSAEQLNNAFESIAKNHPIKEVLIVEDNREESQAIHELLASQGISAANAHSGTEAIAMLKQKSFDCVILDINLPDMQGLSVLKQMKAEASFSGVPVVIYSGKELTESEESKYRQYAHAIVIKTDESHKRLLEEVKLFMHQVSGAGSTRVTATGDALLTGKKVLLADDDMRNIFSVVSVLESYKMEILVAHDGKQAVEMVAANPDIAVVLLDIMMPEMDGIEATRRIRSMPGSRHLPIIALTARAMEEDKQRCLEAGISDYITKPIDISRLLSLLRVWIYKQ